MKALIHESRVCEVRAEEFPVADPLRWVDCPPDATPESHHFDGDNVVAKPVRVPSPEEAARTKLVELDQLLKLRGIREGLLGLFAWMDYLRGIPEGLDAAGVTAYLRALPLPGTGAAKLKQVDDLCAETRQVLAPK